jgi:hypothetical protein
MMNRPALNAAIDGCRRRSNEPLDERDEIAEHLLPDRPHVVRGGVKRVRATHAAGGCRTPDTMGLRLRLRRIHRAEQLRPAAATALDGASNASAYRGTRERRSPSG